VVRRSIALLVPQAGTEHVAPGSSATTLKNATMKFARTDAPHGIVVFYT